MIYIYSCFHLWGISNLQWDYLVSAVVTAHMSVAKLRTNNTIDTLKPMTDNSVNTYIRQAVGNESLLSFSRNGENPVQWVQLLNALDQPDLPGWPFLTPVKIQMQKCEKCTKEFCSPINYRRHIRVHRRSFCVDKEWHKNRDLLGAYWDKLSAETAKEVVSFDDMTLEDVPGPSIIWSLTSFVRKPGYGVFPHQYVKAGSALLDIIQNRPAALPISSQELFAILDDASEGTFLSNGTAHSMQKFVFDGEAGKIGMEPKNLVACTSFLVEQNLVRGWIADMDAESLRCQQLLVEEEEAAQRRQAKLLERKRQKKLRQKEHKAREQANGENAELDDTIVITVDSPDSYEPANLSPSSESSSNFIETPVDHPLPLSLSRDTDAVSESGFSSGHSDLVLSCPNNEHQKEFVSEYKQSNVSRWQVQKTQRGRNGFHISKSENMQRNGLPRDPKPTQAMNGNKVWTRKPKPENNKRGNSVTQVDQAAPDSKPERKPEQGRSTARTRKPKPEKENNKDVIDTWEEKTSLVQDYQTEQKSEVMIGSERKPERDQKIARTRIPKPEQESNGDVIDTRVEKIDLTQNYQTEQKSEVMIGSISVILGNCNTQQHSEIFMSEKQTKANGRVRSKVKLWRPVSRQGNRGQSSGGESTEDIDIESNGTEVLGDSCQRPCGFDNDGSGSVDEVKEGIIRPEGFSTEDAKAFLSQRWKEAIAGDHVTLILTQETELLESGDVEKNYQVIKTSSDSQNCTVLGNLENMQENVAVFEPSNNRPVKGKVKTNPEKGVKTKYIPKKKISTGGK